MADIILSVATAAETLANDLIPKFHPHLLNARMLYVFTSQTRKKCDRVRLASAQKLGAMQKFLSSGLTDIDEGYDFLILIGQTEWDELRENQKVALIDHELEHCGWQEPTGENDEGQYIMKGHDVEEFRAVLERHGFWRQELLAMAKVTQQMTLEEAGLRIER